MIHLSSSQLRIQWNWLQICSSPVLKSQDSYVEIGPLVQENVLKCFIAFFHVISFSWVVVFHLNKHEFKFSSSWFCGSREKNLWSQVHLFWFPYYLPLKKKWTNLKFLHNRMLCAFGWKWNSEFAWTFRSKWFWSILFTSFHYNHYHTLD